MPLTLSRNKSGWKVPRKEGSEVRGVSGLQSVAHVLMPVPSARRVGPVAPSSPRPPGRPSPSSRQKSAGSEAGCPAPGWPQAPASRSLQALKVLLQLSVKVLRGGWGPRARGLSGKQGGGWAQPSSASICPHCRPAPPNKLAPRSFIFISVKTASAFGCSLEATNNSCPGFMSIFWDRCCSQTNSESKSWALSFLSGVSSVSGICTVGIATTTSWYDCEDSMR